MHQIFSFVLQSLSLALCRAHAPASSGVVLRASDDALQEDIMEKQHNLPHLEAKLKELKEVCASFSDDSDFTEMLKIIHRPGWTTVAEFFFVNTTVESLLTQARSLLAQRKSLLAGSREIETGRPATV